MPVLKERRSRFTELYAEQEQLRLAHNEMGRRFTESEITHKEWQQYLDEVFEPHSLSIISKLGEVKNKIMSQHSFKVQALNTLKVEYPSQTITDEDKMGYLIVLKHAVRHKDILDPLQEDTANKILAFKEAFKRGV